LTAGLRDGSIDDMPHARRLRIHTRLPVVLPERIDDGLLDGGTSLLNREVPGARAKTMLPPASR
jgi:hypothetical protein